ncbi:anthranilate phosphoribosyltransferase [Candidatus Micrarchaeota archaeon]|nr:anthranilate phosphoribosyltransferase [Candidatus Micrarchaeota archaeon]
MILQKIIERKSLTENEAREMLRTMIKGELGPVQAAALLIALKMKGESTIELAGFAKEMRENATLINPVKENLVDTCGTGGDSTCTFNISTTSALIAAGAGINIAKHGNRAISGKCGSADLLEELGVQMLKPEKVEECIDKTGFGFMFAPYFHPAMKNIMPIRKELGVRTVFNMLGPLTNPANAKTQVLGVYDANLTGVFAEVLRELGTEHGLIVHSEGMDEIGFGITKISELKKGEIENYSIEGADFGFEKREIPKVSSRKESAEIVNKVLKGEGGAARDVCILNAAAAIYVGGAASLDKGIRLAEEAIDSGEAMKKLEEVVKFTGDAYGHS